MSSPAEVVVARISLGKPLLLPRIVSQNFYISATLNYELFGIIENHSFLEQCDIAACLSLEPSIKNDPEVEVSSRGDDIFLINQSSLLFN